MRLGRSDARGRRSRSIGTGVSKAAIILPFFGARVHRPNGLVFTRAVRPQNRGIMTAGRSCEFTRVRASSRRPDKTI
ncbi:hypothetical protein BRPE64_ACDS07000 [Caballeronia insecticola]|uniref:Uncharacterized protein n=1 Tax=Caballeronia insecticola TaxID=758793 RepID=R4WFT8_9BURK|nr:hypothetical protein BRPE64_ACDS07000 [Caballeronia insecticola]